MVVILRPGRLYGEILARKILLELCDSLCHSLSFGIAVDVISLHIYHDGKRHTPNARHPDHVPKLMGQKFAADLADMKLVDPNRPILRVADLDDVDRVEGVGLAFGLKLDFFFSEVDPAVADLRNVGLEVLEFALIV